MVEHTEVNGIRTVLAPMSGPMRAGLVFRVGRADETLATGGITHLIEHLALHRQGLSDFHFNGATSATETHFLVQGSPAEVVSYLNGVCASLGDLPLQRLETEKEILRTEAAGQARGQGQQMPAWRYGAQGYGLVTYPQFGLHRIGAEEVEDWTARWFTRQNAVLWMTSDELPEGLDMRLPDGDRQPCPAVTSALPVTPAYFCGEGSGVMLQSVVPRSTAARVFSAVLGRELFRELRQEGGLSYTAAADYDVRDADFATITAFADALPKKQDAVLGGFIDVLAKVRVGRISQADLDSVRGQLLDQPADPDAAGKALPGYARNLLHGHRNLTADEARAELEAVTVEDLRVIAGQVAADALLMTPAGTKADWAGFEAAPTASTTKVEGRFRPSLVREGWGLIVGDDGVTMVGPEWQSTVLYEDCVAVMARPDGARYLTGADGMSVEIEPTLFELPAAAIAKLDAAVPEEAVVPLPARAEEDIPRPPKGGPRGSGRRGPRSGWYGPFVDRVENLSGWDFALIIGLSAFLTVPYAAAELGSAGVVVVVLTLAVLLGPMAVFRSRQRAARRRWEANG